ncbi:hypothetical protein ES703_99271 [subsurface metagenome]
MISDGVNITRDMDYAGGVSLISIKLKGINHGTGRYIYCLQETIIVFPMISDGINITRDIDYSGSLALISIKLKGINDINDIIIDE